MDTEFILKIILRARDEIASVLARARAELRGFAVDSKAAKAEIDKLNSSISSMNTRLKNLTNKFDEWHTSVHGARSAIGDLHNDLIDLDKEFKEKIKDLGDVSRAHKDHSKSMDDSSRSSNRLSKSLSNTGDNVATLGSRLRGIGLLLVFSFAQQLITALGGLGGELVAVAGSAAMAGSALAGGFSAGAAQALPVIGLLVASLSRVKQVFDAVQSAQKLQQAQFVSGGQAAKQAADKADALSAAQSRLSDAHDRENEAQSKLKDAQDKLNQARREASDELQQLILDEKNAELAARGAARSQAQAQEQLRLAISGGDVEGLGDAQLNVLSTQVKNEEAILKRRQATRNAQVAKPGGAGIEGLDSVKTARKEVDDAKKAIDSAKNAVSDAADGIEKAKRSADTASGSINTAAQNLAFLLSQLSPAERELYKALIRIRATYKELFRPITDIIVNSFTYAVDRADEILKDPKVIKSAKTMATAVGGSFNQLTDFFSSDKIVDQILRIVSAGTKNIPIVTGLVEKLGKIFLNIAEDAGPALTLFLKFIDKLADRFLNTTEKGDGLVDFFISGEEHLESWINLFISLISLFAALTGEGGAASGKKTIDEATSAIDDLTDKVKKNGDGVKKFFEDARQVSKDVLRVVVSLARELSKVWDPSGSKNFADILTEVVIPALGVVIRGVGQVIDTLNNLFSNPVVKELAQWTLAFLILSQVAASTVGAFVYIGKVIGHLASVFAILIRALGLSAVTGRLAYTVFWTLSRALAALAGWPGLIILGIVLLLAKLGLLDDAARAVLSFFAKAWEQIKEPLDGLIESLNELWKTISGSDSSALKGIFKVIIDFFGFNFSILGTGVGKAIGDALTTITGFIDILDGIFSGDWKKIWSGAKKTVESFFGFDTSGPQNEAERVAEALKKNANEIQKAETDLANSQKRSAEAQRDLTDARRSARRELSDLESRSTRGKFEVREQRFALTDAESQLTDLKKSGAPPREIAKQELEVAKAREELKTATRESKRAEQDYTEEKKKGIKNNDQVLSAAKDLKKSQNDEKKRLSDLAEAHKKASQRIKDAHKDTGFSIGKELAIGLISGLNPITLALNVLRIFKSIVGKILDFLGIKSPSKVFFDIGTQMAEGLLSALSSLPGKIVSIFGKALSGIANKAKSIWDGIRGIFGKDSGASEQTDKGLSGAVAGAIKAPSSVVPVDSSGSKSASKKQAEDIQEAWNSMRAAVRRGANDIEDQYRDMRVNTTRTMNRLVSDHRELWGDVEASGKRHSSNLSKGVSASIDSMENAVFNGMKYVADTTNKALKAFDASPVKISISPPEKSKPKDAQPAATGGVMGWVGRAGQRGKDKILAYLGEGEVVLNHWQQKALNYMLPTGHTVQSALSQIGYHGGGKEQPGFASGGNTPKGMVGIPGNPGEFINPSILNELVMILHKYRAKVTDGWAPIGTHAPNSDHHWGGAVDLVPSGGAYGSSAGNWDLIDKLAKWAEPTQGHPRPPFRWVGYDGDSGHGRGNHLHLSWAHGQHIKGVLGELISKIRAPKVSGGTKPTATLSRSMINKVVKAANKVLNKTFNSQDASAETTEVNTSDIEPGPVAETLIKVWRAMKLPFKALLSAFETGIVESNMKNLAGGDRDSQGWRQERASLYPNPRNVVASAGRFYKEWEQFNDPGETAGQVAAQVQRPDKRYVGRYDAARSQALRMLKKLGVHIPGDAGGAAGAIAQFAKGGIVPGQAGSPVNAIVHAGEWILNKFQQSRLASLLGMNTSGLRSMLGFHGEGGSKGYAGGGVLDIGDSLGVGIQGQLKKLVDGLIADNKGGRNSSQAFDILKRKLRKSYTDVIFDVGTNDAQASVLAKNLRRAYSLIGSDQNLILSTVNGPDAKNKNKIIRKFAETRENVSVVDWANNDKGLLAADRIHATAKGYIKRAKLLAGAVGGVDSANPLSAEEKKLTNIGTTKSDQKRIKNIGKGLYDLPAFAIQDWEDLLKEVNRAFRAIGQGAKKIKDKTKRASARTDAIDELIKEGGIFDQMEAARTRFSEVLARKVTQLIFTFNKKTGQVQKKGDDVTKATSELSAAQQNLVQTSGERSSIKRTLDLVNNDIKNIQKGGVTKKESAALTKLKTQQARLQVQFDAIDDAYSSQLEEVFNSQVSARQSVIDQINTGAEKSLAASDIIRRGGAAIGDNKLIVFAGQVQKETLTSQVNQLNQQISKARKSGLNDLADQITQQVNDLNTQIFELIQQQLRDAVEIINQTAQRRLGRLDLFGRFLDATGAIGQNVAGTLGGEVFSRAGISQARNQSLNLQKDSLSEQLRRASAQGNIGLVKELTDSIIELQVAIAENTKATLQSSIDDVNTRATQRLSRLDLFSRALTATGAVGQNVAAVIGGESLSRSGIFDARGRALQSQRSGLIGVLQSAQAQGNMQMVQDLTDALADLDVTIQENIKAAFQARVDDVNSEASFALGINSLNQQIVDLTGQISNNTDQAAILGILQERQNILLIQRQGLEALLEEARRNNDQQAVRDLTTAVLENQVATLQNTQAINTATGATTDPQTFSSSAWTLFREAIFDGMGRVLTRYNPNGIFLPANMTSPNTSVSLNSSTPTSDFSASSNITEGDTNINLYGYDRPVDVTEISAAVGFAKKTSE